MNKKYICNFLWFLAICLLITAFSGCSETSNTAGTTISEKSASAASGKSTSKPAATRPANKPVDKFSASFKKLNKNPLNEDIQYMLWLTSISKDTAPGSGGQSTAVPLVSLVDKFKKLVDTQGVHYTEIAEALGMKMPAECWLKNGKFKKVDNTLNEVTVFDGQYYTKYKTDEKTGTRYKKDIPLVAAEISTQAYGALVNLTRAPYQQKEDQKFEAFDCNVFFMDIELMGMKGNTLWVDKNTGMLVKNSYGDAKKGMLTYVARFEAGGFKDDVFTVPADIKLVDK